MKVLVCGAREWRDAAYIFTRLDEFHELYGITEVIEGCARGADRAAEAWAIRQGLVPHHFPADWDRYRPADPAKKNPAGAIRNRQMLVEGQPDIVIAFHRNLNDSKGTADMVKIAREAQVLTYVFPHSHEGYRG